MQDKVTPRDIGRVPQTDQKFHHATLMVGLKPETLIELDAIARIRTFPQGANILPQGEALAFVGNVVEGVVRMEKLLSDGRRQIVGLLIASDMFGRVFTDISEYSIDAATPVTLCCFERHAFEALVRKHPDLEHAVLMAVLDELDASREWIMMLSGMTVQARLATYLLILCRRWPHQTSRLTEDSGKIVVNVPVGRSDLAHYLGTTVESISRSVQTLARDGLIRVHSPSRFEILDLQRLIDVSDNADLDANTILAFVKEAWQPGTGTR